MSNLFNISLKPDIDLISSALNYVYPSDDLIFSNASFSTKASTAYYLNKETYVNVHGVIRVSFDMRTLVMGTCYGKIFVNGLSVGTERSQGFGDYQTYTEDISVEVGDAVQIYTYHSDAGYYVDLINFNFYGVLSKSFLSIK